MHESKIAMKLEEESKDLTKICEKIKTSLYKTG